MRFRQIGVFFVSLLCLSSLLFGGLTTLREIKIEGLAQVSKQDLPSFSSFSSKLGREVQNTDVLQDLQRLYLTGYFAEVKADFEQTPLGTILTFQVQENPTLSGLEFNGNEGLSDFNLSQQIDLEEGEQINLATLDEDKNRIESYYHQKGFTLAKVTDMQVGTDNILNITVNEGQIGSTSFSGLDKIQPFVVNRGLLLKPGDPFNTLSLRKDRERLVRLGYFQSVSIPTLESDPKDEQLIHVHYSLKERKFNLIDFGLEQREDAIVTFIRSEVFHVLQHSDRVSAKVQAEPTLNDAYGIRSYSLGYYQPWFLNRYPFSFSMAGWTEFTQEFQTSDRNRSQLFRTQRTGVNLGLGFPFLENKLLLTTFYKDENVSPEAGSTDFSNYKVQSVSMGINYANVDNFFNANRGGYWRMNYEKGGDLNLIQLGGLSFTRITLNAAGFIPVTDKRVIGIRGFFGYFRPDSSDINTFEAEGFVLGGANSLRGYKDQDTPFIGNRQLLMNLEYRHTFTKLLQGVLFYDVGRTFNNGLDLGLDKMETGYGIGIRFLTPIAPIRFDFAYGSDFLIQFGLGQLF